MWKLATYDGRTDYELKVTAKDYLGFDQVAKKDNKSFSP